MTDPDKPDYEAMAQAMTADWPTCERCHKQKSEISFRPKSKICEDCLIKSEIPPDAPATPSEPIDFQRKAAGDDI